MPNLKSSAGKVGKKVNLQSSVNKVGRVVTQILIATSGVTKTYENIVSSSVIEGKFCKFRTTDGRLIMVNTANVFVVEVFEE